ncbi:MAG: transglutaminase-like domain-containing protein [Bacillota bacterium]
MISDIMDRIRSVPALRYGLPPAAAVFCAYMWALGLSHHGIWAVVAVAVSLLVAGLISGVRGLAVTTVLALLATYVLALHIYPQQLEWVSDGEPAAYQMHFHQCDAPALVQLRREFDLEQLTAELGDDTARMIALASWVSRQWSHSGTNRPSNPDPLTILREARDGASFRCVEYSIVLTAAAQSLGMPARTLGMKTRRADTARAGAGHVVTEVWLDDLDKWVLADGQYGYVVTLDEIPLNAVELQRALADRAAGLQIESEEGQVGWLAATHYFIWVSPYLYHFDFAFDQRQFVPPEECQGGALMLSPAGGGQLRVFQRHYPLRGYTYLSCPEVFYRRPDGREMGLAGGSFWGYDAVAEPL